MSQALWQQLKQQGQVSGDEPVSVNDGAPWYIRTMLGIAGWFGALFLLGAVFSVIGLLMDSALTAAGIGVSACVVAVLIYRMPKRNDFMEQFAFAISLAGQSLLVYGLLNGLDIFQGRDTFVSRLHVLSLVTICLQTVLFFIISNYLHRIWSAFLVIASLMFLMNYYGLYPLTMGIFLAGATVLWLQEFKWAKFGNKLSTVAYALVFMALILLFAQVYLWPQAGKDLRNLFGVVSPISELFQSIAPVLLGAVLIALVLVLLKRAGSSLLSGGAIAALLLSALAAYIGVYLPGITVGTVLVLLGFSHSNRVLIGLGLVTVVVFVFQFYYLLELSLLYKSGLLVVSGLALLTVRQLMNHFIPAQVTKHA